jgi:ABC-type amino acid transport substrate-binding protein
MRCAFEQEQHRSGLRLALAATGALAVALLVAGHAAPASAATLDRVKAGGKLTLGYRTDAQPFSYRDSSGAPAGYSVALCQKIAGQVKTELGLSTLSVEWVPVTVPDRFSDVQQGKIDLLCGGASATLTRMKEVSFSIPIFPGGIGALLRADSPALLRELLTGAPPLSHPVWRGSPARTFLEKKTFAVVKGTTSEPWLAGRLKQFEIDAGVTAVESYDAGVQRVLDRKADVLFGDRAILLLAEKRNVPEDLLVIDRLFTYEPIALGFSRGDEDLRLLVDRTLSRIYRSEEFGSLYSKWFGSLGENEATFFQQSALPE